MCDASLRRMTWSDVLRAAKVQAAQIEVCFDRNPGMARRIGYSSNNSLAEVITAIASMLLGAVEVPFDSRVDDAQRTFDTNYGGLWVEPSFFDQRGGSDLAFGSRLDFNSKSLIDHPALILQTSGTTAQPKGVVHTHRGLLLNAAAKLSAVPQTTEDVRLCSLPLAHAYARTCDFGTWLLSGSTLAIGHGYSAWKTLAPLAKPTLANTVPSLADRLLVSDSKQVGTGELKLLGCGGAAMLETDFMKWADRGVAVIQGYGLTETGPVICSSTPESAVPGFVGGFVEGWEYQIRNGVLHVRGPSLMQGYFGDTAATRQSVDADGWFNTGDLVEFDKSIGQLRVLGRSDDVIVLDNGRKVNPRSVEEKIEQLGLIRHAVVVGAGRRIAAWVELSTQHHDTDVSAQIKRVLKGMPQWYQPAEINLFDEPLSESTGCLTSKGSIRRNAVRTYIDNINR